MTDNEAKRKVEDIDKRVSSILDKTIDIQSFTRWTTPIFIFVLCIHISASIHNYVESQRDKAINKKLDALIEQVETLKGTKDVSTQR